jgi:hypothetical protein
MFLPRLCNADIHNKDDQNLSFNEREEQKLQENYTPMKMLTVTLDSLLRFDPLATQTKKGKDDRLVVT